MNQWNKTQAVTWQDYKPPSKLSKSELKIHEKYIKKANKVLILGSTIELRDLCYKYNIKPYVVDNKKEVYKEWSKFLKRKGEDHFIHKNWLNMKFDFKFDLILGDLCFQQLTFKQQITLAKIINNLLDKNGVSIQRTWIKDHKPHKDIKKIVEKAKKTSKKYKVTITQAIELGLVNHYYNYKEDCIDSGPEIIKRMKPDFEKGIIPKNIWNHYEGIWKHYKNYNWMYTKKDFTKMIKKHFKIKIKYGKDFYRRLCPIYILRR